MPGRWVTAATLLVLAWAVAVPLTAWFARARWTAREPAAALLAWQAIGLSGGLAVLTAELTVVAPDRGGSWRAGVSHAASAPGSLDAAGVVAAVLLIASAAWLVGVLGWSFAAAARTRARHRELLDLLSRPAQAHDQPLALLEATAPLAYSVPGRPPHVVVSTAARDALTSEELRGVLAHERAHLRQRHTLLVQPFVAWQRSLPFLRAPRAARTRVEQLVELLCDGAASRTVEPAVLASALHTLRVEGPGTAERLERLADGTGSRPLRLALCAGAGLLVAVPPLLLITVG